MLASGSGDRAPGVMGRGVSHARVRLWREAVVADVDPDTLDVELLYIEGVEEVRVLGACSRVVADGLDDNISVGDVLGWSVYALAARSRRSSGELRLQVTTKLCHTGLFFIWMPVISRFVVFSA